jgi:hypothetical protein
MLSWHGEGITLPLTFLKLFMHQNNVDNYVMEARKL